MATTDVESVFPNPASRPIPLLWISRFVLMKTPTERPFLRDVPLHRGLNIVYVEEAVERETGGQIEIGHGVGKTSFCRLIRYCLDEDTFGRKAFRSRVVHQLPEVRVALEVHVNGFRWAICRSLSNPSDSSARADCSIEELLQAPPGTGSYQTFRQALLAIGDAAVPPVASDAADNPDCRWSHLLAWCARDQETRYQTVWEWRSRRSESGTPAFSRPKADAVRFMARVLGLRSSTEITLQDELDEVERRLGEVDQRLRAIQTAYSVEIDRLRRDLAMAGVVEAASAPFHALDLFTVPLPERVRTRGQEIDNDIAALRQRLQELGRQIAVLGASINEARQVIDERETVIRVTQAGTGVLENDVHALQADLEELRRIGMALCRYGQVTFGECDYIRRRIAESEQSLADTRHTSARDTAQRDQAIAAQQDTVRRVSARVGQFEQQQRVHLSEQEEVARRIGQRLFARSRLDSTWAEFQTWHRRRNGEEADSEADALRTEQASVRLRRNELQAAIMVERAGLADHLRRLSRLFRTVVRRVLSDDYDGRVTFDDEELEFSIAHGSLMAGEAVETLCVLLADLTALFGGATGLGHHPGWLLHDSPREADLGIVIYRRLLQGVSAIGAGDTPPPFQYIVTTATPPPESLRQDCGAWCFITAMQRECCLPATSGANTAFSHERRETLHYVLSGCSTLLVWLARTRAAHRAGCTR